MELPETITAAIVRGVAAYMQGARPTDLPVVLRPLRGKHQKMLIAKRRDIISALDDEGVRAQILDWLKDKPSGIARPDATILGIAARRDDGWERELQVSSAPSERKSPAKDTNETLRREKERTRKAKEEARRAKAEAERDLAAERKQSASFRGQVDVLEGRTQDLERSLASTRKELVAARSEMDREVRKARKRAEKAEAALDEQKTKVRELRAELAAAKAPVVPRRKKPATPPSPPEDKHPKRRRRLAVPKGRFEDDPETLTEWLSVASVHLLVDGYNVSKAEGGFGDLTLERQRERLLQEVEKVARRHKIQATVIFDGSDVAPGTSRRARGPVEVEYSRPDEIADDHLVAKLEAMPKHPVVVVTNDRELQGRAARLGATIATSNQLLRLIR